MKKTFKIFPILVFLILPSCGFSPMLKNVSFENVKIKQIDYVGPNDLIYYLRSNLNIPTSKGFKDSYVIKIKIKESASSVTKDTAGVTTEEKITIDISFTIFDKEQNAVGMDNIKGSRNVSITNNISTDSENKRIEKENIITDLIQQLSFAIKARLASANQ